MGKCAIIPQASFTMTMTAFCALPVTFPSNAVTRFESQLHKSDESLGVNAVLESKTERAKVM